MLQAVLLAVGMFGSTLGIAALALAAALRRQQFRGSLARWRVGSARPVVTTAVVLVSLGVYMLASVSSLGIDGS